MTYGLVLLGIVAAEAWSHAAVHQRHARPLVRKYARPRASFLNAQVALQETEEDPISGFTEQVQEQVQEFVSAIVGEEPIIVDEPVEKPKNLFWRPPRRTQGLPRQRRRVWEDGDDDVDLEVLDAQVTRIVSLVAAEGPAVTQFNPQSAWLWGRWRDTVLEDTWKLVLANMGIGAALVTLVRLAVRFGAPPCTWPIFTTPCRSHPFIQMMLPLNAFWSLHLTLTTFIVTFFLGKAYDGWRASSPPLPTALSTAEHDTRRFERTDTITGASRTSSAAPSRGGCRTSTSCSRPIASATSRATLPPTRAQCSRTRRATSGYCTRSSGQASS